VILALVVLCNGQTNEASSDFAASRLCVRKRCSAGVSQTLIALGPGNDRLHELYLTIHKRGRPKMGPTSIPQEHVANLSSGMLPVLACGRIV